jgi:hypothetical protein
MPAKLALAHVFSAALPGGTGRRRVALRHRRYEMPAPCGPIPGAAKAEGFNSQADYI